MPIRSPIITVVGHIDHGKTTLLDKIRGTYVTRLEPGEISQHVGASHVPIETVKKICGALLQKLKIKITIPGLLFVDTPGHAAFVTLRKRGGAVSDLAILVVDVNEGFKEQTDESLAVLKEFKTPFLIAATKIDKIFGWHSYPDLCFADSLEKQREDVKNEVEKKVYRLVTQLAERGFDSERFDRIKDFKKQIAVVPCSGISGEGIAELLMVLTGLAQQFLKGRLEVSETAQGTVLEVKKIRGFGLTIDVILYNGSIKRGDYLVVGGKKPIITKIKALLRPRPLQELRVEKRFESIGKVSAAAGIKISAPNLEGIIAGSPIVFVKTEKEVEEAKKLIQKEVEEVQFTKEIDGIVLKADTLGSLEAMIRLLKEEGIPIKKAEVGNVTKEDIVGLQNVKDDLRKVVLAFNVKPLEDAKSLAKDLKIKIFPNKVIYKLIEEYKEWCLEKKEREIQRKFEEVSHPVKIKFLKGFIFRASHPAIFGVEVLAGLLRPGVLMKRSDGKTIGKVKELQKEGKTIKEAKKGDRIAVSIEDVTVGRQVKEGDILISAISEKDMKILREIWDRLSEDERALLKEF
jgi:translation initiation factor 5B